jgi:RNA recognition motif-containing protein
MNIYVGNLTHSLTSDALRELFQAFGEVKSAKVVIDHETGRSRGFGFVIMNNDEEAQQAIAGLHGKEVEGRKINVNEARPLAPRTGEGSARPAYGERRGGFSSERSGGSRDDRRGGNSFGSFRRNSY